MALNAYVFNSSFMHPLVVFHIGVGSGVACSTSMGNARASMRGTGNKEVPTLFLFFNSYIKLLLMGTGEDMVNVMNENKPLKIFSILAFIAFAAVSCWATAESLHLLLSSWPAILCWIVSIGFFVIASLGSKLIVDSLNQKVYIEKRGLRLTLGTIMLLVFWLACSMPTNTHTFFYRSVIHDKVASDITTTKRYLEQIINNEMPNQTAKEKCAELENKVEAKLGELEAEIKNEANPGFGEKSKEILSEFAGMLHSDPIKPLSKKGTSIEDRELLCNAYRNKIRSLLKGQQNIIRNNIRLVSGSAKKEAKKNHVNLELVEKRIANNTYDLNDANDIKTVCDQLAISYATIKNNKDFVYFNGNDEAAYTAENAVSKVKRMISVFDVWQDYLAGKYDGHGFLFWIIISILVDVAAFIFFDIAFKKRED